MIVLPLFNFNFLVNLGNVGVPIKLLYEAEGMKVTAEVSDTIVVRFVVIPMEISLIFDFRVPFF